MVIVDKSLDRRHGTSNTRTRGRGNPRSGNPAASSSSANSRRSAAGRNPLASSAADASAEISKAWEDAIAQATSFLRDGSSAIGQDPQSFSTNLSYDNSEDGTTLPLHQRPIVEHALEYLQNLHQRLTKMAKNGVPKRKPPPFLLEGENNRVTRANDMRTTTTKFTSTNPFSLFSEEEDEESTAEEDEESVELDYPHMVGRRIHIRVLSSIADILRYKAKHFRQSKSYRYGAAACELAEHHLRKALTMADTKISQYLMQAHRHGDTSLAIEHEQLVQDAEIVHISVTGLVQEGNRMLRQAEQYEAKLIRQLEPQWQRRDEIKAQMGPKWFNNPVPKNTHYESRKDKELALKDVKKAIECLRKMDVAGLVHTTTNWMEQLKGSEFDQPSGLQGGIKSSRYNGLRPDDLSQRVSLADYPDPSEFGWKFTGSNKISCVEFFEKDSIKLDWYYTTGTMKTSLYHPGQKKYTQLFLAHEQLDPSLYIQILLEPRAHTSQRYHRTSERKKIRHRDPK